MISLNQPKYLKTCGFDDERERGTTKREARAPQEAVCQASPTEEERSPRFLPYLSIVNEPAGLRDLLVDGLLRQGLPAHGGGQWPKVRGKGVLQEQKSEKSVPWREFSRSLLLLPRTHTHNGRKDGEKDPLTSP